MKKLLILILVFFSIGGHAEKLSVAASAIPHAEILAFLKPLLAKEGVELQVKIFTDYVQPNIQVFEKHMDANFFQHLPYLEEFNKGKKTNLVSVVAVHVEPFGAYSRKVKKLSDLKENSVVAVPNDPTNLGRALLLLQKEGLIELKKSAGILATPKDIVRNPKKLKIKELEAAMLARVLEQVDVVLINTNYALAAKLNPLKDALAIEDKKSPYANILVARPENKESPGMLKLKKALTSAATKKFIEDTYKGAIVPAF